jgi:putative ATPase
VPKHLRDAHYSGSARLGHGANYKYPHEYEGGFVQQDYLGVDKMYYRPTDHGLEAKIRARLEELRGGKSRPPESPDKRDAEVSE